PRARLARRGGGTCPRPRGRIRSSPSSGSTCRRRSRLRDPVSRCDRRGGPRFSAPPRRGRTSRFRAAPVSPRSFDYPDLLAVDRQRDRDDEDYTVHGVLDVGADLHQYHPVVEDRDDEGAEYRIEGPAYASRERYAADRDGRHRGEHEVLARAGIRARQSGDEEDGRQGVDAAGDGEDRDLHPVNLDAGLPRECLVAADRVHVGSEPGPALDREEDRAQDEGYDYRVRDLEEVAVRE